MKQWYEVTLDKLFMYGNTFLFIQEIKCDLCDYVANSKQKMKWHTANHFSDFKECPNCGKMTKKLKAHFR